MTHHILTIANYLEKPIAYILQMMYDFAEARAASYAKKQAIKKAIKDLSSMTDKELADIGINRYDIPFIVRDSND